ncbi:MAG: hypothetical protein HY807_08820 [Nitrospirae bacterium]|nr:hypothetical protein [Nitrospirota bacterium]
MRSARLFFVSSIILFLAAFSSATVGADTFVVTNPDDSGDYSLRWAIEQANLNPGEDTIFFDNSYTIYPMTELPALNDSSGGTTIDGENFEVIIDGSNASLLEYGLKTTSDYNNIRNLHIKSIPRKVETPASGGYGIWINSSYNIIYGCKIYMNDHTGILLGGGYPTYTPAEYNKIQACYIGSSDGVTSGQGNNILNTQGGISGGIYGFNGAKHTIIGVDGDGINDENEGNVISGNSYPGGIFIMFGEETRIAGNMIGVDKTGTVALPNTGVAGIAVGPNAIIGTDGDGVSDELERNIISGNQNIVHGGVRLEGSGSRVSGNYIGVDITGAYAISNEGWGISFRNSSDILIGTDADGISDDLERNIISGNKSSGIALNLSGLILGNIHISGNYIGTDVTGTMAIGNETGISITAHHINSSTEPDFFIGTNGDGANDELERNIISGNGTGIFIGTQGRDAGIQVSGNYIGTDVTGINALPNKFGIKLNGSSDNIIGTNGDGIADDIEGNVIVANGSEIWFANYYSVGSVNNRVSGNYIGTNKTGNVRLSANTANSIYIGSYSHNNIFGTNGDGISDNLEGNIITGGEYGVYMIDSENNRFSGNNFGLGADGISQLGLGLNGISLSRSHNTILGTNGDGISDNLEGNTFIGNGARGNAIQVQSSNNCRLSGNYIGIDRSGTLNAGFGGSGILIQYGDNNLIGTDWDGISDVVERNTISNNGYSPYAWWYENDGVTIKDGLISGEKRGKYNTVQGNSIYNNTGLGIDLLLTANDTIMAPVIDSSIFTGSGLLISGTAPVASNVEVFVADADPSGAGEGKTYKGRTEAVDGSFSVTINDVNVDDLITATSTDSSGNTSEFAVNMSITGNSPPELYPIGDKQVDEGQWLTFNVNASDPNRDLVTIAAANLPSGAIFDGNTFDWMPDYNQAGVYSVTFIASDGIGGSDSSTINITVNAVNTPPATAPTGGGTYHLLDDITLGGQVSDSDGDILSYTWHDDNYIYCSGSIGTLSGGNSVSLPDCAISGGLSVGTHIIYLEVSDGVNDPVNTSVQVDVIDTAAPTLAPVANTNILWPPNHEMAYINITTNVYDNSGCFTFVAEVTSNEPENDLGDGDMSPDFTEPVIDQENGIITLQLRAERAGLGNGRSYSVMIIATDCSGNTSTAIVEIAVPHDRKKK